MKWDRSKGRPEPIRALNRIREIESGEPLVDLRSAAPSVRIYRESTIPFVRATVAEMAERAARLLPDGVHLAVTDAWRPFERQVKISEWMERSIREAFPDISYTQLRRKACRWVAPVDQKAPPGHCTGAAIDVLLLDEAGEEIDLVSPFERFQASPTYVFGLSEQAHANRSLLVSTMLEVGFSNCRDEYWHYSYGDAGWAVRSGLTECMYGLAALDESIWRGQQDVWLEALLSRPNPFFQKKSEDEEANRVEELGPSE